MLSADSIVKRFGRVTRGRRRLAVARPGRPARARRPERVRQEHARARSSRCCSSPTAARVTIDGARAGAFGVQGPARAAPSRAARVPGAAALRRPAAAARGRDPRAAGRERAPARRSRTGPRASGSRPTCCERFPHEVSEGQLQRACLARALIVRPRYLICDELSSMLDVSTQAALLETIARQSSWPRRAADHPRPCARRHVVRRCRRHHVSGGARAPS